MYSFNDHSFLQENSLYKDAAERKALVADKSKVADALLYNFFGMLGLLNTVGDTKKKTRLFNYMKKDKSVRLKAIGDDNHDISLSIKLAAEAELFRNPAVIPQITMFLAKLKTGGITDIDNDIILGWAKSLKPEFVRHISDVRSRTAWMDWIGSDGKEDVSTLAISLRRQVRKDKTGMVGDYGRLIIRPDMSGLQARTTPGKVSMVANTAPAVAPVRSKAASRDLHRAANPPKITSFKSRTILPPKVDVPKPPKPAAMAKIPFNLAFLDKYKSYFSMDGQRSISEFRSAVEKDYPQRANTPMFEPFIEAVWDMTTVREIYARFNNSSPHAAVEIILDEIYKNFSLLIGKPDLTAREVLDVMFTQSGDFIMKNSSYRKRWWDDSIKLNINAPEYLIKHLSPSSLNFLLKGLIQRLAGTYATTMHSLPKLHDDDDANILRSFMRYDQDMLDDVFREHHKVHLVDSNHGISAITYSGLIYVWYLKRPATDLVKITKDPLNFRTISTIFKHAMTKRSGTNSDIYDWVVDQLKPLIKTSGAEFIAKAPVFDLLDVLSSSRAVNELLGDLEAQIGKRLGEISGREMLGYRFGPKIEQINLILGSGKAAFWERMKKETASVPSDQSMERPDQPGAMPIGSAEIKAKKNSISVALLIAKHGKDMKADHIIEMMKETGMQADERPIRTDLLNTISDTPDYLKIKTDIGLYSIENQLPKSGHDNFVASKDMFNNGFFNEMDVEQSERLMKAINAGKAEVFNPVFIKRNIRQNQRGEVLAVISNMVFELSTAGKGKSVDKYVESLDNNYKQRIRSNMIGAGMVINEIQSSDVKTFASNIDSTRMKQILSFNDIDFGSIMSAAGLRKKQKETFSEFISRAVEQLKTTVVLEKPKADVVDMDKKELARLNKSLVDKHYAGRHGDIYPRIVRVLDVHLPSDEYEAFKKEQSSGRHNKQIIPAFHGTGGIAAAMILRYGFKVVPASAPGATGRMLGDGIYFSNKIDKSCQYVGNTSFTRRYGTRGYIFDMTSMLGREGVNYKSAGTGGDAIRSPEWVVFDARKQLNIVRAYEVELVSKSAYQKIVGINESANIQGFKNFMTEGRRSKSNNQTIFMFGDGNIPVLDDNGYLEYMPYELAVKQRRILSTMVEWGARGATVVFRRTKEQAMYQSRFADAMPYNMKREYMKLLKSL